MGSRIYRTPKVTIFAAETVEEFFTRTRSASSDSALSVRRCRARQDLRARSQTPGQEAATKEIPPPQLKLVGRTVRATNLNERHGHAHGRHGCRSVPGQLCCRHEHRGPERLLVQS